MPRIVVEDQSIYFDERGRGPALLLIHSFPHDHRVWEDQAKALSDRFRVITPDLPGFGQSPPMAEFSIEAAASLILKMIDQLKVGAWVVGGISMGGYISLAIAKRAPANLIGLILADTKAAADTAEARQKRSDAIHLIRHGGADHLIEQMVPLQLSPDAATERPEVVDRLRGIMKSQTEAALITGMSALRDRLDYSDVLAAIDVPTLLLYGQQDAITSPGTAESLVRSLKRGMTCVIPNAGHISTMDQPSRVIAKLKDFLMTLPRV